MDVVLTVSSQIYRIHAAFLSASRSSSQGPQAASAYVLTANVANGWTPSRLHDSIKRA